MIAFGRVLSLTVLSNVVAYTCRPLFLEGSASCSRASLICLQCHHRRAELTSIPGLYAVRKNSRSPEPAHAQCCFVLAPNQTGKHWRKLRKLAQLNRTTGSPMVTANDSQV